ncbi:14841_t:CDS:2, partial [Funneliformis geosporum]
YIRDPSKRRTPLSIDSKLITLQKVYLVGQGGSGKIIQAICAFPGQKVVVLIPENLLAEYYRKQNPGLTAMIYHKYFHLEATPIDEWDPACLGKKVLAEILIFDEACMIPKKGDKEGLHKFLT